MSSVLIVGGTSGIGREIAAPAATGGQESPAATGGQESPAATGG